MVASAKQSDCLAEFSKFFLHSGFTVVVPDIIVLSGISKEMAIGRLASQLAFAVIAYYSCGSTTGIVYAHVATALPVVGTIKQ